MVKILVSLCILYSNCISLKMCRTKMLYVEVRRIKFTSGTLGGGGMNNGTQKDETKTVDMIL